MSITFTPRLQSAINFAAECHRGQNRKNENETPYIAHPYSALLILSEYTNDEDIYIAMLLHDTVEDCGVSFEEIENMFGERVKDIVYHVTEPKFFGSDSNPLTWKERKENYLALLETGPTESLLVATCDKIHNMSTINKNLVHQGTFWFLDKVMEILESRSTEISQPLIDKYKNKLSETKTKFN